MLDKIYGFTVRLFTMGEETKRNRDEIKELRQEQKQTQKSMRELTEVIQQFAYETQRRSDKEGYEREKMELRLQNSVLRAERFLPPGNTPSEDTLKSVFEMVEQLRAEMKELRDRLEQLENSKK